MKKRKPISIEIADPVSTDPVKLGAIAVMLAAARRPFLSMLCLRQASRIIGHSPPNENVRERYAWMLIDREHRN